LILGEMSEGQRGRSYALRLPAFNSGDSHFKSDCHLAFTPRSSPDFQLQ
jgi:hypothetical protein